MMSEPWWNKPGRISFPENCTSSPVPSRDNTGALRIKEGEEPSFEDVYNQMDWAVENVEATLPQK